MKRIALVVLASALAAAAALADTVRHGERIPADSSAPVAAPALYAVTLPGPVSALAGHVDGRAAVLVRQEIVELDATGKTTRRTPLPAAARFVDFGAADTLAAELATGSTVLHSHVPFTRAWDQESPHPALPPQALPFGGFAFARSNVVVWTDSEAHELRRTRLAPDLELLQLAVVPQRGVFALARRTSAEAQTVVVALGWGEHPTTLAVVRGILADAHVDAAGAELAFEDGSLARIDLATSALTRTLLPDDAYALTARRDGRSVAILRGQLMVVTGTGARTRFGAPFGPPVIRTDAGMIVPRVVSAHAGGSEPLWLATADGTIWRVDGVEPHSVHTTQCDGSTMPLLQAIPGRVLIGCQNQLTALLTKPS